jgi:hypothetical protein
MNCIKHFVILITIWINIFDINEKRLFKLPILITRVVKINSDTIDDTFSEYRQQFCSMLKQRHFINVSN